MPALRPKFLLTKDSFEIGEQHITKDSPISQPTNTRINPLHPFRRMADKMDIDAVNGEKEEERIGPAPDLPPEKSNGNPLRDWRV